MSLKDELEKIIQAEQSKLAERDRKHADHRERQKDRFAPLRAVLEELVNSVESYYLSAYLSVDSATLDFKKSSFLHGNVPGIYWSIQPDDRNEGPGVPVQVVKTGLTPQIAPSDR